MKDYSINTKCVQAGYTPGNGEPRQIPIYQSTTYKYDTSEDMGKLFDLEAEGYIFFRFYNPTNDAVAAKIADLEGGVAAILTSSGQAANFFAIFNICEAGSHVVSSSSIYGGTYNLLAVTMKKMGVDVTFVDPDCTKEELNAAFKENTKAVFGESIANPALTVLDIEKFAKAAHAHGVPLTEEAIADAKASDAVLMGSIGGDAKTSPWYKLEPSKRPEAGLLAIRKALNLFANLRPAYLYNELKGACPLKEEVIGDGFDMIIVRELTGGLYFGDRKTYEENGVQTAVDTLSYNENEIRRIAVKAFDIAMKRNKKVTSVDKANVLDSSRLWRKVVEEVSSDYPEVTLEHMLVDNCAMQLVKDPAQFDVILTENMFGDILSDEASMVTGSIGMLASASLNETKFGLYEPSGGSAPDIAGQGIANPIATILSAAMMLRYSFDLDKEADAIEKAVEDVLKDGYRTIDIMSEGKTQIGTAEMGDRICAYIQ